MSLAKILLLFLCATAAAQQSGFELIATFSIPEARQGVAVDSAGFYAIDNGQIGKYDKKTGRLLASWRGEPGGPILHLDSGVTADGKLVCAHSNYPGVPMTGSVEIWDAATLQHLAGHSFGIAWGSCTWIDRHDGFWWAGFAHYNKLREQTHTDNTWSTAVQFDDQWRMVQAWIYPAALIERFDGMSNSGGSWGPDGRLYLTGHDRGELYAVSLPRAGSILVLNEIIPLAIQGQGIAWDRSEPGVLYAIQREKREVRVFRGQFR